MDNVKKAGADLGKKAGEIARKTRDDQASIQDGVRPDEVARDDGHASFDEKLKDAGLPSDIADEPKVAKKTDDDTEVARQVTPNLNG